MDFLCGSRYHWINNINSPDLTLTQLQKASTSQKNGSSNDAYTRNYEYSQLLFVTNR